ncbi:alpha/beta hydrolase [Microvirga sp. SRT01]|uniref:Alpha/beta hydrolase n=1 Tax=Sphingomonas longa TaxID=2778730 RepID=A0ABS2DBM4_9SPHN|nr:MULTISPECIES: alpha/beta hydrolase [Alphaproteobacteria]MBM6578351.1 alpha/beta hydrolase [Sphingomonas sp. BT552]MBR7711392.1 alpha/beta hydrolase [Microvirga sp. SRT01]
MDALRRNNVQIAGSGTKTIVFSHGFGCDQSAWYDIVPRFANEYRTISFDHVGSGGSDLSAYDPAKYDSLHGYAQDVIELFDALNLESATFVGHSVGAMIGLLAAIQRPQCLSSLIMLCPSPYYVDEPGYVGGFTPTDLEELLEVVDSNFLGWSRATAPIIMGNPERPELGQALGASFCRTDPAIAKRFARVTFLSDHRADLPLCGTRSLVMQTRADMIAPEEVGAYIVGRMPNAELALMDATGHCPHMSAPAETIATIERFLER